TYAQLQRPDEGMAAVQEGIEHLRRMARDNPAVPIVYTRLIYTLRMLAAYQRNAGKIFQTMATLKQAGEVITALPSTGPDTLFTRACVRAAGTAWTGETGFSFNAGEHLVKKREADQAMEDLHEAVAAGFRDVGRLRTARELAALRSRQDF